MSGFAKMLSGFLAVGFGGALGAMARYAVGMIPSRFDFPVITLIVNFAGAVLIGFIVGISSRVKMPAVLLLFLKTGVCGGFTTFSTFSLEAWQLLERRRFFHAGAYAVLSVSLCVLGVMAGQFLGAYVMRERG